MSMFDFILRYRTRESHMIAQGQNDNSSVSKKRRRAWRFANATFNDVLIWVGTTTAIVLVVLFVVGGCYLNGA
ncbi:hypothetical protein PQR21_30220 [Paraburkholderia nemoris]|uniref:hypothetical protein n=1 Tax=Paraburkholderia nemoris TaxID=2793076 RepID=UPI0038BDAF35